MEALRHVITAVVLALVFSWLWRSSRIEQAKLESGRKIFPPTRAIRILTALCGVVFTTLFIVSWISIRKPTEWWVPYLFLSFVAIVPFMYPPVLSIEVDGVASRTWFGREKKIRWEDIASLHYNTGNRQFTVRANDGGKITHFGFNADAALFRHEIHERTRLPMKVARPGTWKTETIEVPYEEAELSDTR
jgi:hypothetical protein